MNLVTTVSFQILSHLSITCHPTVRLNVVFSRIRGSIVVKALCYEMEVIGLETRRCEGISSIYVIFPALLGPVVYSASNRIEFQKQKINVFLRTRALPVLRPDKLSVICELIV
jgi:hypothetical protein